MMVRMAFQSLVLISALVISTVCAASCPDSFEGHQGSCYFFSHGQETWIGAFESCKLFGAMLVEVNDAAEDAYLLGKASSFGGHWWIALNDKLTEAEYVWATSHTVLKTGVDYANWGAGQPNNHHQENCVVYDDASDHKWHDTNCYENHHYICEASTVDAGEVIG